MPIYRYRIESQDVEFDIYHSISKATMKNTNQILTEISEAGVSCLHGLDITEAGDLLIFLKEFPDEEIHVVMDSAPSVHYKGGGWPSNDMKRGNISNFVSSKAKSKIQDSVETRRKRMGNGHSVVDVRQELGISGGGGSVINNSEWKKLDSSQKNIAKENGLKPSAAFEK